MADEPNTQTSRAEQIRAASEAKQKEVIERFQWALDSDPKQQVGNFLHAFGLAIVWGISALPEIAAELAEANSRDREAEIRAKRAEDFVAGIQQELARQGIIVAGATLTQPRKK